MSAAAMADLEQQKSSERKESVEGATLPLRDEEEVKLTMATETHEVKELDIDLLDRDPNQMNDYVKVRFSEIFGEPDSEIHSFDKIWQLSFKVFSLSKTWCYRITSLVLGLPLALVWGVVFACLAFCNNWCYVPGLRCCHIELIPVQKVWNTCLGTFVAPCFQTYAYLFSKIRITTNKDKAMV